MSETRPQTAREILKKAAKLLPESSSGRQAVVGCGLALLEVRDELAAIRSDIAAIAKQLASSRGFDPGKTLAALAGDVPDGCKISQCRSCEAPVIWVTTTNGKKMPLDAKPLEGEIGFGVLDGIASKAYTAGKKYESHFATCPNADSHRRTRGAKQ